MQQEIHITLQFDLATGKATLNEIVYLLKQLRDQLMVEIVEQILRGYDELICDCLSGAYPSHDRKGLGQHALLKEQDKPQVSTGYQASKAEIVKLIEAFKDKGYDTAHHIWKTLPDHCSPLSNYG